MVESSMLSRTWKTGDDKRIKDMYAALTEAIHGQRTVYIGTDSQQNSQRTEFVTVIVVHEPMKGGRVFYTRESVPRIKSRRERLLKEAWLSVATALEVNPMLAEESTLEVHIDANPNTKFESSKYVKDMVSMVVSQGFAYKIKPDAWAAMHVADHMVKYKVIGRQ
jgi:predicted RNase H-related nuclease YkuK (DUF458 family)